VVLNHAGAWGQIAMFLWADRYRPVTAPNWDQLGTLPSYVLLVVRQLAVWCVPAFLFVSGYFIAYTARGEKPAPIWKVVGARIRHLLVPYLIWSVVIFVRDAFLGDMYGPIEYLRRLVAEGAGGGYYYVPLLCYLYLLSPLVVRIAKARCRLLLSVSALIQLGPMAFWYLKHWGVETPVVDLMIRITPSWSPSWFIFFFALGVVAGLHVQPLRQWLAAHKWGLLAAVVMMFLLNVLESDGLLRARVTWYAGIHSLSYHLYAVALILCFLAFDQVPIPFSGALHQLGKRSYGIYLLHHVIIMESVARVMRQITPWVLAYRVLFVPLIFACGLGGALLFMAAVSKSPVRRAYRYLLG